MSKKHDENQDVRSLMRNGIFVDTTTKRIRGSKSQSIGNNLWGRIDFLTNYCGYTFLWDNTVISKNTKSNPDTKKEINKSKKIIKKMRKDNDSSNKSKKK